MVCISCNVLKTRLVIMVDFLLVCGIVDLTWLNRPYLTCYTGFNNDSYIFFSKICKIFLNLYIHYPPQSLYNIQK